MSDTLEPAGSTPHPFTLTPREHKLGNHIGDQILETIRKELQILEARNAELSTTVTAQQTMIQYLESTTAELRDKLAAVVRATSALGDTVVSLGKRGIQR